MAPLVPHDREQKRKGTFTFCRGGGSLERNAECPLSRVDLRWRALTPVCPRQAFEIHHLLFGYDLYNIKILIECLLLIEIFGCD